MDTHKSSPDFLQTSVELKRLRRDTSHITARDASLGNYARSINRLSFSADSRILAVSDISGFLDTWVIEGHEKLTPGNDDKSNLADAVGKSDSSDEADSEEDEDEEEEEGEGEEESCPASFGERWIRNPAASLLAKLPAAPLVLTFRPSAMQATGTLTSGGMGVSVSLHKAHLQPRDQPNGEDRLFVLTAENQIYEFNVLSGTLSDWSRRNPTSSLPQEFRQLRDRAKNAVWDMKGQKERIWLFGVSWLWMFDLSRDLPSVDEKQKDAKFTNGSAMEPSLKRKRGGNDEESAANRPRLDTGAGSKISNAEFGIGIGSKMRKIDGEGALASQWVNVKAEQDIPSDEDDYVLANGSDQALIKLRRGKTGTVSHMPNGHLEDFIDADTSENDDTRITNMGDGKRPAYWHTYKYRPILGIVPLGGEKDDEAAVDEENDDSPSGLEVALVERPLFDVDLPPRYFGNQEWDP